MTGAPSPSLFETVAAELRALGITITTRPGEYCVNFRNGAEATRYLTDELSDALEHGRAMAAERAAAAPPEKTPAIRRKWRRPISAKAQRRRLIRAHNHRMRGRALKKQREEG